MKGNITSAATPVIVEALAPAPPSASSAALSGSPDSRAKIALGLVGAVLLLVVVVVTGCYMRHPAHPVTRNGDWRQFMGHVLPPHLIAAGITKAKTVDISLLDRDFPARVFTDKDQTALFAATS